MMLVQICPSYKPAYKYGGPTVSISMLCEQLQSTSLKVLVLTTTGNGDKELRVQCNTITRVDGVSVRYFKRLTKDHSHFSPALCLALHQHIRKVKKSNANLIIHIHSWWNLVSILSCLIARLHNISTVISPRGMLTDYSFRHNNGLIKKCIHIMLGKWLLNGCHLHATSDKEKQDILSFLQPKTIVVIPNIVSLPALAPIRLTTRPCQPFKLLFFSRIDEKKGIELLLSAVAKLSIDYKLTIAGTGTYTYINTLKSLTATLEIAQNVTWLGHIALQQKYVELSRHDLLVLPSFNENFANVVIESLSVGTAVLISDQVGVADYILASGLGWVSKLNSAELAANIMEISRSKGKLTHIRINAPKRIAADFNSSRLRNRYLDFYNGLLAEES
jgi:glycosyltransferase involved in cell wall biosynthesis